MNRARTLQQGALLIETLVALLIIAFGILGFVGLQARTAVASLEGYQRAQALILLNDMAARINANRQNAAAYAALFESGGAYLGASTPATCPASPVANRDLCEWTRALLGAAEQNASGDLLGAVTNARGCIKELNATDKVYLVAVFWQGARASGPSPVVCGPGATAAPSYGNDNLRRAVSLQLRIGKLS